MTRSSKDQIDLLVRVGILEKLLERLDATVSELQVKVNAALINPIQHSPANEDEWEINNETGTVDKKEAKPEKPKDDLDSILDS